MRVLIFIVLSFPLTVYSIQFSEIKGRYNCPDIKNSHRCALHIENRDLSKKPFFERKNDETIVLTLRSGVEIVYENNNSEVDRWASFAALEYIAEIDSVLLLRQYHEGSAYLLLNLSTGIQHKIDGYPSISPNGQSIVIAERDLIAGYNKNLFQIYRIENEWHLEFDANPTDWGPSQVNWVGDDCISFFKFSINEGYFENGEPNLYFKEPMQLKRTTKSWQISPNRALQTDKQSATPPVCH